MHRKLQRSVTEILRSVICLPNLSWSAIFNLAGKIKSPIRHWNRAHAGKRNISGVALLSNQPLVERLARFRQSPDRVREAPAFPPEPSSLISGSPSEPWVLSCRLPRSELFPEFTLSLSLPQLGETSPLGPFHEAIRLPEQPGGNYGVPSADGKFTASFRRQQHKY